MSRPDIDVVGTGLICSLGNSVQETFDRMCRGECGIRRIHRFPVSDYPQQNAGILSQDTEEQLRLRYPDDDLAAALIRTAAAEAMAKAGLQAGQGRDSRFGLVLATNFGPVESLEWGWREQMDMGRVDAATAARVRLFVRTLADGFGCAGPVAQISLSCASGAGAVALAMDWVRAGRADRVLALGYDCITDFCWTGLTNLRTITTDAIRPFDIRRSGTIFSEGAGAFLLERAESRRVRGSDAMARLLGAATNNNAFHMTAPAKDGDGSRRVMAAAIRDAQVQPDEIDHVSAHATATTANDVTEAAALRNLLGSRLDSITVAAHKSQLGHMMGAAGVAEAIVTVEVINRGVIPPTVNHEQPDPACRVDCVPGRMRQRNVRCALTNSAGIGGNNVALVLRSA